jgi:EAL domain-containing protein (putative c-di-GMP-specific phosphodiesterase class I)
VVDIARGLGKRTIAEYVGDRETFELLKRYGVDYAQGFYVARPQPLSEVDLTQMPTVMPGGAPA